MRDIIHIVYRVYRVLLMLLLFFNNIILIIQIFFTIFENETLKIIKVKETL